MALQLDRPSLISSERKAGIRDACQHPQHKVPGGDSRGRNSGRPGKTMTALLLSTPGKRLVPNALTIPDRLRRCPASHHATWQST